jgi:uncharacterized membrane protein (UPF0127 family)
MSIWRPSTTGLLIGGLVIVIVAAAIAFMVSHFQPTTEVRLGSGVFKVRLAQDETSRQIGLSETTSLKPTEGLLMIFDSDSTWEIWMKDMKVPIDIIWLDSAKKVVYTVKNATPDLSTTKIFMSKDPARYVLELPAGSVQQFGITSGDEAEFTVAGESN